MRAIQIVVAELGATTGTNFVVGWRCGHRVKTADWTTIFHFVHSFLKYLRLEGNPCRFGFGLKNVLITPSPSITANAWVTRSNRTLSPLLRRVPSSIRGSFGAFRNAIAVRSYSRPEA